jgi:hypothetical protein
MNQDKDKVRRRNLIKAAVSMPIIATIPSGAVAANASTNQCIISAKNELEERGKEMGVIMPVEEQGNKYSAPTPDQYLRAYVSVGEIKDRNNPGFKKYPVYQLGEKYVDNDGNEYTGDAIVFKEKGKALVAIVFRHNENMSEVELIGLWPDVGLYDDNIALSGSCWTSLSPNSQLDVNI